MADSLMATVVECLDRVEGGSAPKLMTDRYRSTGAYPIIDQGQAFIAGWTDDDSGLISDDLPLIVFGDHTRAFKYVDFPFVRGADGTQLLKPKAGIDPRYFYYACLAIPLASRGYNRHFKQLKESTIRLRGFDEQVLIGRCLHIVEGSIDAEVVRLDRLEALKRTTMHELFTRGLRGEVQKDSEIGPMPESWEVVPFSEVVSVPSGLVDPKVEPYASLLHVGPENIEQDGALLLPLRSANDLNLISGKYLFTPGQIIYSKIRPYLNKVIIADFPGLCSADMYPLDVASAFDPQYVLALMRSRTFVDQAIKDQGRTGIPKLNREQLYAVKAPKPSIGEQQEIGTIASAINAKINLHKRKKLVLEELFRALLHKLMTEEIRVADLDLTALEANQEVAA